MKLIGAILSLFFVATTLAAEPPIDVDIEQTHIPSDCSVKSKNGDAIKVHYTGKLFTTGAKFDSSLDRGNPLPLTLGAGQVIAGWEEGLQDMCIGEKRTLTIPANKAYGSRGAGGVIPPNAALVFDVELTSLNNKVRDEL